MIGFTGNPALFLLLTSGMFLILWGGLAWGSFWAFRQTDYYKTQWPVESGPAKFTIKTLIAGITFVITWAAFFR
jgi:hypothetical protein